MSKLNQNTILNATENALIPSSNLIDGRTDRDWLSFIADFASLINFYDTSNQINGSWLPFLLKDPVIILASISKTNITKKQSTFVHSCLHIDALFQEEPENKNIGTLISALFDQLFQLFIKLERWIHYLLQSDQEFSLKKYILYQVEHIYSSQLWALLSLRRQLILNNIVEKVESFESTIFQSADTKIWKTNKDKKPYWEILNLNPSSLHNKIPDFITAIKKFGDQFFNFFITIIQHATIAFEALKTKTSHFPDTVLVRTFIKLLMHHRNQLNEVSQKHLDFYYNDILLQNIRNALPDSVFIAIILSKKNAAFLLQKGTLFDAGVDSQKKPIIFSCNENVSLNPTTVVSTKTITVVKTTDTRLLLQKNASPSVLKKSESGKTQGWPIFGNELSPIASTLPLGFALATPLLYLKEGERTIQIIMTFNEKGAIDFLHNATYSLSTQNEWLVVPVTINELEENNLSILLNITLDTSQPAIEAFLKNPDGYDALWPLLKIELNTLNNSTTIPILRTVQFDVSVQNISSLQLYNDFGALDAKKPFELFGPTPSINNSFILGSNEIFSKPFNSFQIDLTWDTLPKSFQNYYQEYNTYLSKLTENPTQNQLTVNDSKSKGLLHKIEKIIKGGVQLIKNIIKKGLDTIIELLKEIVQLLKDILGITTPNATIPFNNVCFTIDFELLNNASWTAFDMTKQEVKTTEEGTTTLVPYTVNEYCVPEAENTSNLLFSTTSETKQCELTNKSFFNYSAATTPSKSVAVSNQDTSQTTDIEFVAIDTNAAIPKSNVNPNIQNTPLIYSEESTSGFLKMALSGPAPYGFGSQLYPEIVASIALQNALLISKNPKIDPKKLLATAKLPFAPKLKKITANYSASQLYDVTKANDFPLQCFAYTPFVNYLTYDSSCAVAVENYNVGDQNNTGAKKNIGVPLLSSLHDYKGFLYIELANVIAPNKINFYVELGRKEGNLPTNTKPDYYYLSTSGWQLLPLLSDTTNNLSCSGILTFNFPEDISNQTGIMDSENYWICVATKNEVSNYPDITFLTTNGVLVTRSGSEYLSDTTKPQIEATTISKPHTAIPEIASIQQPFPSFGGKAMETNDIKNKRISNRLKTKDRNVSSSDFYSTIQQEFNDIYYSKSVYATNKIQIYVVKKHSSSNDYSAFAPMVSTCLEKKMQQYLSERSAAFTPILVSNFAFLYVTVNATISLLEGYELEGIKKIIENDLNLFLSPWITTNSAQIAIDEELTTTQVIDFIKTIEGVSNVENVILNATRLFQNGFEITCTNMNTINLNENPELLIVSSLNHDIK
ncbi:MULTISPECIES: hypothetical protein [Flavobacterium]|uniref:Baseplate J-like protein n=2 Tax=Flavobacterium TaxID=237 RepID=A0ABV5GT44_9FLAO|nr:MULTISPECIES: hypothetical protein [Flavobacterium]